MRTYDILIVGGGLAGLGCARTLWESGHADFCLVTDTIGGRAPITGRDVLSPAFYARSDYRHLMPFLSLGRRATIWKGRLITDTKKWRPQMIAFRHPLLMLRFAYHVWAFDRRYQRFMGRSESVSQKEAMEEDPILSKLYCQSAADFLKEHHLESLGPVLISTLVRVTHFVSLDEASAFLMLWIWLLLIRRAYECTVDIDKMTAGLQNSIVLQHVSSIHTNEGAWVIETASGQRFAGKRLVLATPITVTQEFIDIPFPERRALDVFMAKVKGRAKSGYVDGRYNVFPLQNPDVSLVDEEDGTYELFSLRPDFDLSIYFEDYEVLHTKEWRPASFASHALQPVAMGENLFIIGDGNFPCMEAAYVSGMSVAKTLLQSM